MKQHAAAGEYLLNFSPSLSISVPLLTTHSSPLPPAATPPFVYHQFRGIVD